MARLTKEEEFLLLYSEIKKRKEAFQIYQQAKRIELAQKENQELEILQKYLPEQLSPEQIKDMAQKAIKEAQACGLKETGKVMAKLMPEVKGKASGEAVSKIVRELLSEA